MVSEEMEFLISQHADGVLDPARAAEVDRLLTGDAEARAVWLEHRRVTEVLRAGAPLPALDWDRVADAISSTIAEAEAAERERVYRLPVGRWAARVAAVAAVLAIGLFARRAGEEGPAAPTPPLARVIEVQVPAATETLAASRVMQVSIVPAAAEAPEAWLALAFADLQESNGPRIVIAAGPERPQSDPFEGY